MREARRPSVSSVASTTYQRRSISLSRTDVGLRVHRSSCSPSFSACRSPEGDAAEAEPLGRGGGSVEGRSPVGECRPEPAFIHLPRPTSRRTATMRRTIPRRKASARTSIVTSRPSRRTRTAMHGPDRRAVRRPEGAEVVPADEDRPGPLHRGGVERDPHPERRALAERAARPVPDGVAVLPVPRRVAGVEPGRCPAQVADRDVRREERVERPTQLRRREAPVVGEGDHLPRGVHPGIRAAGPVDPPACPVAEAGERGLQVPLDRPVPRLTWKPAKSVPSYSTRAR